MDRIPPLRDLRSGDCLVVDFLQVWCLAGPARWILRFEGDNPGNALIRTAGHRVIPAEKSVVLTEEQEACIDEVLRGVPDGHEFRATSYKNFTVTLLQNGQNAGSWEFKGISPSLEHPEACEVFMELCMVVPHEYRGMHLGERMEVALLTFGATLVFAVAMLLRALWFPFRWLYKTIMRCPVAVILVAYLVAARRAR